MRVVRPALCIALAGSLLGIGVAEAAKKPAPVCNQVVDDKGDAEVVSAQPGMDIVSGDLASNAKKLVAVTRLASKPNTANPEAVGSTRYYFQFNAPGSENPQYLSASIPFGTGAPTFRSGEITPSANGGSLFTNDAVSDAVTGTIVDNVITITADVAALSRVNVKPKSKITGLTVSTYSLAGVLLIPVDDAAGAKPYSAGAATCVKLT